MGLADGVKNARNGARYLVSTLINPLGFHETAVLKPRFLIPKPICGVSIRTNEQAFRAGFAFLDSIAEKKHILFIPVQEVNDAHIRAVHAVVRSVVEQRAPDEWLQGMFDDVVSYLHHASNLFEDGWNNTQLVLEDFIQRNRDLPV